MQPEVEGLNGLVEVGRGGFGTVYRARDDKLGRDVAVKVIRDSGMGENIVARFERECKALGALSGHPNIVAVHGLGPTEGGDLYFVMEYLPGGSLAQRLAASGPASFEDVAAWGTALAGALETAHRSGIVHRDVKPDNVLFSEYGTPKLVDFGIARMRSAYETRSGFFSATLNHAAPEVVAGAAISASADIYSLASVLFYALVGSAPFERTGEDSLAPLIARITTASPPNLREYGVPEALAAVIERALSKEPDERYESAEKFGDALRAAAMRSGANVHPVPIGDRESVAEAAAVVADDADITPLETAQVGRRRVLADVVASPEPTRPSRKRLLIVLAAAVIVVLAAAGLTVVLIDGPEPSGLLAPGEEADLVSAENLVVVNDPIEIDGLRIERRYQISRDTTIGSSVQLSNTTKQTIHRVWFEIIPKGLADNVAAVAFSVQPDKTVLDDPIVYWVVDLQPGASRTLAWHTPLPVGATATAVYLNQAIVSHQIAVKNSEAIVSEELKALEKKHIGQGVDPGKTVKGPSGSGPDGPDGSYTVPPDTYTPPADVPGGGYTPPADVPGGGYTPGTGGNTGGGGPGTTEPPDSPRPPTNHSPTVSVSDLASSELKSVSFNLGISDPDGDRVTVSVSGLPPGIGVNGTSVSGTIRYDAASLTVKASQIQSRSFSVTVVATDGRGGRTTKTFTWRVADTYLLMPNYIDKYGCGYSCSEGVPNVADLTPPKPAFACAYDPNGDNQHIWRQSIAPNTVVPWGVSAKYWYGNNDKSCDHVNKGW